MSPEQVIRVLIVDDVAETRENLRKLLYFETDIEVVATATNGQEAIEMSAQYQPHVVLMDINMPELDGISASGAIRQRVPTVQIIMMSVQSEADYLRRSMMAGASDFLTKPFSSDDLVASIRRVYEMSAHLRAMPAAQMTAQESTSLRPTNLGKVIAVFSPKGGVGCTTVLINLAVAVHQIEPSAKVAVMDCNMQFGDVGISLYLKESRSITDLAGLTDEIDLDLIESAMIAHDASGLRVLLAPLKPEEAELITTDHVRIIVDGLRQLYDYVLIDMGSTLQDMELAIFDLADRVILITAPDVPSIKDIRLFYDLIEALEYTSNKFVLILNKADPRTGVTIRLIESNVKKKVFAEIPFEGRIVLQSVNQGVPYMIMPNMDKRLPLFVQTTAFAEAILKQFEEQSPVENQASSTSRPSLGRLFN
ncbi:MAG: response regulator [Anaerolineae bacterium]|nr:response regulator [Anaerolineae bacterium]